LDFITRHALKQLFRYTLQPLGAPQMIILFLFLSVLLGIFLNGLADNLPESRPELQGADLLPVCRYCGATRKMTDLSAILSIFIRGGNCGRCHAPRPFRDLIVEIILGIIIPAIWLAGVRLPLEIITLVVMVFGSLLMIILDIEHRTIILGIVLLIAAIILVLTLLQNISLMVGVLLGGATGIAIMALCYLIGWLLGRVFRLGGGVEPLGQGDIWVAGIAGMIAGWPGILPAILSGILLAGVFSVLSLLVHVIKKESIRNITFAFGPYLLIGAWIVHLVGNPFLAFITQ
jgi:prepilin signal peptidase PulO-like enzyme (type II secretory pathway)